MRLPQQLAIICFVLSQGIILLSYSLSVSFDHVESCNPFLQGCLNITDAGIQSPEGFVFRAGMISACSFFIMWWAYQYHWFQTLEIKRPYLNQTSFILGCIGAICLIVATTVLVPERSNINWTVHVLGATLFFLISFVAQAINAFLYYKGPARESISANSFKAKLINVALQALIIIVFLYLKSTDGPDAIGNALEWWWAFLIGLYFTGGYWDWKKSEKRSVHLEHQKL